MIVAIGQKLLPSCTSRTYRHSLAIAIAPPSLPSAHPLLEKWLDRDAGERSLITLNYH
ncbi:MAG: hypothetical protein RID09_01515 [Coleofasciculus sp. G1-WW12-02]|uniref:hypothetical protein n=1 Tax=Coleofasciculus sp. G1-WW12-02 TaxID=3068483 RepID=UPI00330035C7